MLTIKLYWWMSPLVLVLAPFVYAQFRRPGGSYDLLFDVIAITILCWALAAGLDKTQAEWGRVMVENDKGNRTPGSFGGPR